MAYRLCSWYHIPLSTLARVAMGMDVAERAALQEAEIQQRMLTSSDLLAYLEYSRCNWDGSVQLLVQVCNRSIVRYPPLSRKSGWPVAGVDLQLRPEDVEKLFLDLPFFRFELHYPPRLGIEHYQDIYTYQGIATPLDVGHYLRQLRKRSGLTLTEVQQRGGLHAPTLSRLEGGVIEPIRLAEVAALDQQWDQKGRLLTLFWEAASYTQLSASWNPRGKKLLNSFLIACRWLQQDSPGDWAWLFAIRSILVTSEVSRRRRTL